MHASQSAFPKLTSKFPPKRSPPANAMVFRHNAAFQIQNSAQILDLFPLLRPLTVHFPSRYLLYFTTHWNKQDWDEIKELRIAWGKRVLPLSSFYPNLAWKVWGKTRESSAKIQASSPTLQTITDQLLSKRHSSNCTGLYRTWRFQKVEAPRLQDNRHIKVVRLSALRTGRLHLPGNTDY